MDQDYLEELEKELLLSIRHQKVNEQRHQVHLIESEIKKRDFLKGSLQHFLQKHLREELDQRNPLEQRLLDLRNGSKVIENQEHYLLGYNWLQ